MRKLEIKAYSLEDAKLTAFKEGFTVVCDATWHWKRAGRPLLTKDLNIFAADLLESKGMFDFKNSAIIITVITAVDNKKKHPSKITNIKRKGRCNLTRTIEIRTKKDDKLIAIASQKMEAIKLARELIKKCREDLYAKTIYVSSDIDFELEYDPSTKARPGQYLVFAVDDADVEWSKKKKRGF